MYKYTSSMLLLSSLHAKQCVAAVAAVTVCWSYFGASQCVSIRCHLCLNYRVVVVVVVVAVTVCWSYEQPPCGR